MQDNIEARLRAAIERQKTERGDYLYKGQADPELVDALDTIASLRTEVRKIADIAEGSTTANSLQHIAKIARALIARY